MQIERRSNVGGRNSNEIEARRADRKFIFARLRQKYKIEFAVRLAETDFGILS